MFLPGKWAQTTLKWRSNNPGYILIKRDAQSLQQLNVAISTNEAKTGSSQQSNLLKMRSPYFVSSNSTRIPAHLCPRWFGYPILAR